MKCNWKKMKLSEIALINPKESISRDLLAKKVSMDMLIPFYRGTTKRGISLISAFI